MSTSPYRSPHKDVSTRSIVVSNVYLVVTIAQDGRCIFLSRADILDYNDFINTIIVHCPAITREGIVVQTKDQYVCEGKYVEIRPKYWQGISAFVEGPELDKETIAKHRDAIDSMNSSDIFSYIDGNE
ncbi:hypothetical protein ARMSODRAFT_981514 [Armillaria solidipes]|uniref:Uncharacterized protein n=1 Tax=Armillaria solidipes TaxID=1076256 RepID=A0A2H3ARF8_9AGAR|nr:hypothetical protein ARMSODRAFT_981514 [Armillaria solidipes]